MIEVIKRPSQYSGEPIGECVHVSFVLDGVQYEYDVPKVGEYNGENKYELTIDNFYIYLRFEEPWTMSIIFNDF